MFLLVNRIISVTKIATESQLSTSINVLPWVILGCLKILEIKKYCDDRLCEYRDGRSPNATDSCFWIYTFTVMGLSTRLNITQMQISVDTNL